MKEKPIKIWKRKNIHLVNEENDIKFRGPLSYRHLRIFGWFFLFISQLGLILNMASNAGFISVNQGFIEVLKSANSLMTPLFLFAAFAQVLVAKDGYRRLLMVYIAGAIGLFGAFTFVYLYFGAGLLGAIGGGWAEGYATAESFMSLVNINGSLSFNVFIDLVLCTLVTAFINYRPTKYFQGNKIYIFRALVALPLLYEIASITLKICASNALFTMPTLVIPLLTTKPPVAFFIFVTLALFVKKREKYYIKHGKSSEEYKEFLHTNVNRLHFSSFLAFTVIGAVILDLLLMFLILVIKLSAIPELNKLNQDELAIVVNYSFMDTYSLGFGNCVPMLLIVPVLFFFDYTKTYKDKIGDIAIPVAGIVALLLLYIFGLFEILKSYISSLGDGIKDALITDEKEDEPAKQLITSIRNIFKK